MGKPVPAGHDFWVVLRFFCPMAMIFFRITVFFLLLFTVACQSGAEAPGGTQAPGKPAAPSGPHFRLSPAKAVTGLLSEGDMCLGDFTEAVPLFPHRTDFNKRYFVLGDGLYRVVARDESGAATFFVRRAGSGQAVDVFTGANFPACLSEPKNFSLSADGSGFQYDNGYAQNGTRFGVSLVADGSQVEFSLPSEAVYGMTVHRCANCR